MLKSRSNNSLSNAVYCSGRYRPVKLEEARLAAHLRGNKRHRSQLLVDVLLAIDSVAFPYEAAGG
jgi:hypothetical protein